MQYMVAAAKAWERVSKSDSEEEEDEEEEKEAMEKEPHLIQMRLALADISENLLTLLSCVHYRG